MEPMLQTIAEVAKAGPFAPDWDSLKTYQIPQWYEDAKFGIFIHWGVYSVPAFSSEWYPRNMYQDGTPEFKYHVETFGPQAEFGYKDFIPQFKAEHFDASQWAALFREAGAKFVVPVAEHHDGFALYDCALSEWNSVQMGPKRDIVGELSQAVRAQNMVFGLSSHRAEHWWFFDGGRKFPSDVSDPQFDGLYGPAAPAPENWGVYDTPERPAAAFLDDWLARTCELVDKYQPQLVWFDWWINHEAFVGHLQKFGAYYYNRGAEKNFDAAINYKYHAFPEGAAVFDVERGQLAGIRPRLWQNDTSVSKNSWGYVKNQDYKTAGEIVGDLIDVVSKNGALLLNIGPRPDGTIPDEEQTLLRQIGAWLAVNGEAIYGTRPWEIYGEGPTEVTEGAFTDTKRAAFTGEDIRFTQKNGTLYAIFLAWPGKMATVKSLAGRRVQSVSLLGNDGPLTFAQTTNGLTVQMPAMPPGEFAFTLKIDGLEK